MVWGYGLRRAVSSFGVGKRQMLCVIGICCGVLAYGVGYWHMFAVSSYSVGYRHMVWVTSYDVGYRNMVWVIGICCAVSVYGVGYRHMV